MKKFLLFTVLLSFFFASCDGPKEPTFSTMKNVRISNLTLQEIEISGDAVFHNPNIVGAKIASIDLDITVNDVDAGNVSQEVNAKIPGNSDFTLPVILKSSPQKILGDISGLLLAIANASQNKMLRVNYKGIVTFQVLELKIPVDVEYSEEIPLKKKK